MLCLRLCRPGHIERISICRTAKRLSQHSVDPTIPLGSELLNFGVHSGVLFRRPSNTCAKKPTPPGKVEANIQTGLTRVDRVVHAVHVSGAPSFVMGQPLVPAAIDAEQMISLVGDARLSQR